MAGEVGGGGGERDVTQNPFTCTVAHLNKHMHTKSHSSNSTPQNSPALIRWALADTCDPPAPMHKSDAHPLYMGLYSQGNPHPPHPVLAQRVDGVST